MTLLRRGSTVLTDGRLGGRVTVRRRVALGPPLWARGLFRRPVRLLLTAVCRILDVEGRTPEQRRGQLVSDLTDRPADGDALVIRHLSWSMMWGTVLAVLLTAAVPLSIIIDVLTGGPPKQAFLDSIDALFLLVFVVFYLSCGHLLKALTAGYLLRDRWTRYNRFVRAVMLSWPADLAVATLLAAITIYL
ncbi:hypothetical protein [Actinoplanes solisilvae]|uniref:hypothetical protein n=1 Tax=Actinoplanes solisilvae TaxID=2486853 RepID=UPI000FD7D3FD|nr:hypothetical protein [Actinoplanes solisilvae]